MTHGLKDFLLYTGLCIFVGAVLALVLASHYPQILEAM